MDKIYPGIEQEWILKGYGKEEGWMGSGLEKDFFLVFKKSSPLKKKKNPDSLNIVNDIQKYLNHSDLWLPTSCNPKVKNQECYVLKLESRYQIHFSPDKTNEFVIWVMESNPITDIKRVIQTLKKIEYHDYCKELKQFSESESQSLLISIGGNVPDLFNWPSWQLQEFNQGSLDKKFYVDFFKRYNSHWPYMPIFKYSNKYFESEAHLYFNGNFKVRFKSFGVEKKR